MVAADGEKELRAKLLVNEKSKSLNGMVGGGGT
jgi:hypothetical protein